MKPDLYTKAVLTVIAFMLVMIGCHQYISPATTVKAEGPSAGVQFSYYAGEFVVYDNRTGDFWTYMAGSHGFVVTEHAKVPKLGENGTYDHFGLK